MTHLSTLALQLPSRPVVIRETFSGWKILSKSRKCEIYLTGVDRTFLKRDERGRRARWRRNGINGINSSVFCSWNDRRQFYVSLSIFYIKIRAFSYTRIVKWRKCYAHLAFIPPPLSPALFNPKLVLFILPRFYFLVLNMAKVSSTISIHPFIFQRCESLKAEEDTHIQHSLQ